MILAAYGTLKSAFGKWDLVGLSECSVLGYTTLKGELYQTSWFPAMVEGDDDIEVELIQLPDEHDHIIAKLDWYEGVSSGLFKRTTREVVFNGETHQCLVYMFSAEMPNFAKRIKKFG